MSGSEIFDFFLALIDGPGTPSAAAAPAGLLTSMFKSTRLAFWPTGASSLQKSPWDGVRSLQAATNASEL
jgi:hypothetical protein